MTPFRKFFRKLAEKTLDRWYEGPSPPRRLAEIAVEFGNLYPHATRTQWAEFAAAHAAESYRRGYARGYEWTERERPDPDMPTPEEIADAEDPDWRWSPNVLLNDPLGIVPDEELPESTLLEEHIREMSMKEPPW